MKLIIDRITEGIAVCETEEQTFLRVPADALPEGCKEGSVLIVLNGEYCLDTTEEAARRHDLFELQSTLFSEDDA